MHLRSWANFLALSLTLHIASTQPSAACGELFRSSSRLSSNQFVVEISDLIQSATHPTDAYLKRGKPSVKNLNPFLEGIYEWMLEKFTATTKIEVPRYLIEPRRIDLFFQRQMDYEKSYREKEGRDISAFDLIPHEQSVPEWSFLRAGLLDYSRQGGLLKIREGASPVAYFRLNPDLTPVLVFREIELLLLNRTEEIERGTHVTHERDHFLYWQILTQKVKEKFKLSDSHAKKLAYLLLETPEVNAHLELRAIITQFHFLAADPQFIEKIRSNDKPTKEFIESFLAAAIPYPFNSGRLKEVEQAKHVYFDTDGPSSVTRAELQKQTQALKESLDELYRKIEGSPLRRGILEASFQQEKKLDSFTP